jgi:hypothetical protein
VIRSGTKYLVASGIMGGEELALDFLFRLEGGVALLFSVRGFSKATLSRSIGSVIGRCLSCSISLVCRTVAIPLLPMGKKCNHSRIYTSREKNCHTTRIRGRTKKKVEN